MKIVWIGVLTFAVSMVTPCALYAQGTPFAKVLLASGSVKIRNTELHTGDSIVQEGVLSVPAGAAAKIELLPSKTILQIPSPSDVILRRPRADEPLQIALQDGMARATVVKEPSAKKTVFMIKTHSATMGVRGTDFMAIANPLFDESEIIVFDGKVEFSSDQNPKDRKLVPKDYWGGIGGRFGAKTHALIHLSPEAIQHFERITTVASNPGSAQ